MPHSSINVEDVLANFYEELAMKLSIDEEAVSTNAFELFTRVRGLKEPVKKLFDDCLMRNKS